MGKLVLNKVLVIKPFPGFKDGDVLVLNEKGIFEYLYNINGEQAVLNSVFDALSIHHGTIRHLFYRYERLKNAYT